MAVSVSVNNEDFAWNYTGFHSNPNELTHLHGALIINSALVYVHVCSYNNR